MSAAPWLAALSLWQREVVRFFREPSRILSAAATPLLFWVLIGSGFSEAFRLPGAEEAADGRFLEYFYPGTLVLVLLFAAIFSTISLIEDRREGFLQGVLVAPVPRLSVVAGKVAGGATLAWLQAAPLLLLAPLAGIPLDPVAALAALGALALFAVLLAALGFAAAWRSSSVQGFHAVMNLLLIPLWLLSGAFFPPSSAPGWLEAVMRVNPLTWGVAAVRGALYGPGDGAANAAAGLPPFAPALLVTALLALATVLLAAWVSRTSTGLPSSARTAPARRGRSS